MEVCWGGNVDTWGGLVGGETGQVRGSDYEGLLVHMEDELQHLVRKGQKGGKCSEAAAFAQVSNVQGSWGGD